MSRGQRRVFESHARQMEQDDRFASGRPYSTVLRKIVAL